MHLRHALGLRCSSMFNLMDHMLERHVQFERYNTIAIDNDEVDPNATFLLYNLTGQLVGYQTYRPLQDKERRNDEKHGRYYSYITNEGADNTKGKKAIGVWGLETFYYNPEILFITEGVFDSVRIHNAGYPSVALMSNHPKMLYSWLHSLNRRIIAICDNDDAGKKLASLAHSSVICPEGHDLGSLPEDECMKIIQNSVK